MRVYTDHSLPSREDVLHTRPQHIEQITNSAKVLKENFLTPNSPLTPLRFPLLTVWEQGLSSPHLLPKAMNPKSTTKTQRRNWYKEERKWHLLRHKQHPKSELEKGNFASAQPPPPPPRRLLSIIEWWTFYARCGFPMYSSIWFHLPLIRSERQERVEKPDGAWLVKSEVSGTLGINSRL